ncbi:DUF5715 family protein [Acidisarcina polymorpha]|nr:DUF5715 family protein [Acidisarcina polymorpha]
MRRYLRYFALMQALLIPSAARMFAAPPVEIRPFHLQRTPRSQEVAKLARRRLTRLEARRKSVRLNPTLPVTTALIDPVPRGKFPFPPPLKGSRDSLLRQNVRSQKEGLEPVQDDADLLALRRDRQLVPIPVTAALLVDGRLPVNRRYCRVWTAQFLADLSRVHYGRFHRPIQLNSAVRTVEYQRHLELINANAAPAEGEDASPHLTGATIDIAKRGLSMAEIGWIRAYLMPLQSAGKVDVEEEFYQSCFHITVYRSYHPATVGAPTNAHGKASLLAAKMN